MSYRSTRFVMAAAIAASTLIAVGCSSNKSSQPVTQAQQQQAVQMDSRVPAAEKARIMQAISRNQSAASIYAPSTALTKGAHLR